MQNFQPFPAYTCVTEAYPPNITLAQKRLEPLGVHVYSIKEDGLLPFENATFDLVINQHESYDPHEVFRILKPGAYFITKQVDATNDNDILAALGLPPFQGIWNLQFAERQLTETGFQIHGSFHNPMHSRFFDVGAVVYYLKVVPWVIEDFHPHNYLDQLIQIHNKIESEGFWQICTPRFMLIAQKPIS